MKAYKLRSLINIDFDDLHEQNLYAWYFLHGSKQTVITFLPFNNYYFIYSTSMYRCIYVLKNN
jgi:hypothetical protein